MYKKAYAWEDKAISDLSPGDILVSRRENGKPIGVVDGPASTGREIVPDQPESADFLFVPIRPIEPGWDDSGLIYQETGRQGIYQVFAPHNKTTEVGRDNA